MVCLRPLEGNRAHKVTRILRKGIIHGFINIFCELMNKYFIIYFILLYLII